MNEFLEQFLVESRELIEQATEDLLALESSPQDRQRLESAFRGFHTLKGAAGIVDFPAMSRLMHAAEEILGAVRAGDQHMTMELVSECLAGLDQLVHWLDGVEADGAIPAIPEEQASALVARLQGSGAPDPVAAATGPPAWVETLAAAHPAVRARCALRHVPDRDCFFRGEDPLSAIMRLPDLLALELTPRTPWAALEQHDPFACNVIVTALLGGTAEAVAALLGRVSGQVEILPVSPHQSAAGAPALLPEAAAILKEQLLLLANAEPEGFEGRLVSAGVVAARVLQHAGQQAEARTVQDALASSQEAGDAGALVAAVQSAMQPAAAQPPDAAPRPREGGARALRIDVERVDALVKLTAELTIVKNAIGHAAGLAQTAIDRDTLAQTLREQHALLDRLMGQLQRAVVGVRVLPLRQVLQRFPRPVREMAQTLGKSVRLVMDGEDTEADKATVEALFEPLLHVLRNAVDHGIEHPAERSAAGKSAVATIRLRAAREGDHITLEVSDDGRGIDKQRIREVAAQRGVASPEALAEMPDDALLGLIFGAGFSTAAEVTAVSGRGVGMDAVRSAIARLGGRVGIRSEERRGTAVTFTLPFSVMMSQVMTVEAGGQTFGIPLAAVTETLRLRRDSLHSIGAAKAAVIRDRSMPVLSLAGLLGPTHPPEADDGDATVVVALVEDQHVAVEVDRVGERLNVMLKPMEGLLAGTSGVAGTTLLGDGRVLIVLNLQDLLQ